MGYTSTDTNVNVYMYTCDGENGEVSDYRQIVYVLQTSSDNTQTGKNCDS